MTQIPKLGPQLAGYREEITKHIDMLHELFTEVDAAFDAAWANHVSNSRQLVEAVDIRVENENLKAELNLARERAKVYQDANTRLCQEFMEYKVAHP